jgi:hypothetical protein
MNPLTLSPSPARNRGAPENGVSTRLHHANLRPEKETANPNAMPFPITQRERLILAVIALLVVLGLLGLAVL